MSINLSQLKEYIIRPTLKEFNLYSLAAENLLLGTCAQESRLGNYVHQISGPALGIFQMEPATHDDIWSNFLFYKKKLSSKILSIFNCASSPTSDDLIYNLRYATIMCRLHYLRVSEKIPESFDVTGLATYWKSYYNTLNGKGTVEEFLENYKRYCC